MCTYSQQKKNNKKMCAPPQGVNGAPNVSKLYASSGKDIEGGSMKLATQVDFILCNVSRRHFRVMNVLIYFFLNYFFLLFLFNHFFLI